MTSLTSRSFFNKTTGTWLAAFALGFVIAVTAGVYAWTGPTGAPPTADVTSSPFNPWSMSGTSLYYTGGNVGIGTATPGAKLEIGGTAGVDGIKFPDGTVQRTAGSGFVDGVTIQSNVSPATTACPTFSDVPNSGKTILLPSGTVAMNWNAGYYSSAGALGVTFRACFGATCGGSQNYMTNEALSHKMASGSWVTSAASGSTLVKLQICRNTGTGAITMDGNDTVSWTVIQ